MMAEPVTGDAEEVAAEATGVPKAPSDRAIAVAAKILVILADITYPSVGVNQGTSFRAATSVFAACKAVTRQGIINFPGTEVTRGSPACRGRSRRSCDDAGSVGYVRCALPVATRSRRPCGRPALSRSGFRMPAVSSRRNEPGIARYISLGHRGPECDSALPADFTDRPDALRSRGDSRLGALRTGSVTSVCDRPVVEVRSVDRRGRSDDRGAAVAEGLAGEGKTSPSGRRVTPARRFRTRVRRRSRPRRRKR